ncbi:transporter [Ganoderma sinense ZZ0214-1]|uniref:Transporter n=1 Tax=Ganoderma sinense ZZ0214-1 TaxID=1077348 RepID=A0A2G8SAX0_9APHY|nr:transporter [Ganoderma sinense ZZ0214-1]
MGIEEFISLGKRLLQKSDEVDPNHEGSREKFVPGLSGMRALPTFDLFLVPEDPVVADDVHVSMDLDREGNILACKIEKLCDTPCSPTATKCTNTFPRSRHDTTTRVSLIEVVATRATDRHVNLGDSRNTPYGTPRGKKSLPFSQLYRRCSSTPALSATPRNERHVDNQSTDPPRPFNTPDRLLHAKDFKQIKLLGHGSGGVVVLVEDTVSGETLVMKVIEKKSFKGKDRLAVYAEQHMLKKLSGNPFFTELKGSFEDTRYFYLLMDYAPRGDLTSYLVRKCDVVLARSLMAELVVALESLHAMRIIHRDVKPANILVDNDYHTVLADFGLARDFGCPQHELPWSAGLRGSPSPRQFGDKTEGWFGTTGYVAPEIYCDQHSYEVDIWSAGVVLYRLLAGELPFGIEPPQETIEVMQRTVMLPLELGNIEDADARSLLRMMLQKDPAKRATWQQIKAHPFFKSTEWERLYRREKSQRVSKARRRSQTMVRHMTLSRHSTSNAVLHPALFTCHREVRRALQARKGGCTMVLLDVALTRASDQRNSTTVNAQPEGRPTPGTAH